MNLDFNSEKPIFIQIAEQIEEAIFTGAFPEESQIPSTTEISTTFKINPATVLKGMNRLLEDEILYKKRGVGVFVNQGAVAKIRNQRMDRFYHSFVESMISEAKKIGFSKEELMQYINRGMEEKFHD